jgi:hypothetical protein
MSVYDNKKTGNSILTYDVLKYELHNGNNVADFIPDWELISKKTGNRQEYFSKNAPININAVDIIRKNENRSNESMANIKLISNNSSIQPEHDLDQIMKKIDKELKQYTENNSYY